MGDVKFDKLREKYRDFFAPAFEVLVEGKKLLQNGVAINSVTVSTSVEKADLCTFDVQNAFDPVKKDFKWLKKYFYPGKNLEIKMGYTDKLETIFAGLIKSVDFDFPAGGYPSLTVEGMDKTFAMMKSTKSRSWDNKKHSDVAQSVGSKYVSKCIVDPTKFKHEKVEQNQQDDFNFLQLLAEENNYEFFVTGKTLHFREQHKKKRIKPMVTLEWGKNLLSFSPTVDLYNQVPEIEVRARDDEAKQVYVGKSGQINKLDSSSGRTTGPEMIKKIRGRSGTTYIQVDYLISANEAKERATDLLSEKSMELVTGNAVSVGLPEIRSGEYIKLQGLGKNLSQVYYILSSQHTINESGYITNFTVEGNTI
ncbi:MAG: phage late control D family protein [Firmicutes bacterium]|nr:phage late control D family protein [Bacillota bacterium]